MRLLAAHGELLHTRGPSGYSLLHYAWRKSVAMLGVLLDRGLAVDTALVTGETVLHLAARDPKTERVLFLLERGATPSLEGGLDDRDGGTPLLHALFHGCTANAGLLWEKTKGPRNLRVAAGLGRIELLEELWPAGGAMKAEAGAHRGWYRTHEKMPERKVTNNAEEIGGEALMYAGMNGQAEAIEWLLDRGVDVNARPCWGTTALHWAAIHGKLAAVETLLRRGADVDIQDEIYRGFPWGWAAEGNHPEIERLTIQRSKTLDLFQACNFNPGIERVRSILEKDPGALNRRQGDPAICGRHQHGTALHEAVDWYKRDVMLLLLECGADVNARTAAGVTPLGIALERKNEEAAAILRERGGTV
jgi:ankyrin repeat protein